MDFIPDSITQYAEAYSSPEPAILQKLSRDTQAKVLHARMLSGHLQGRLLEMISHMLRPRCILEIGTYTGYSAICLAAGLVPGGMLHSIDHNPELRDFTLSFIKRAGMKDRIILHTGEALDVLPSLDESFDLVFIDADKENYVRYFDLVYNKLRPGGIILADNVLWSGKVLNVRPAADGGPPVGSRARDDRHERDSTALDADADADANPKPHADSETLGIAMFNEHVRRHPGVEQLLLPFRDGLMICRKR